MMKRMRLFTAAVLLAVLVNGVAVPSFAKRDGTDSRADAATESVISTSEVRAVKSLFTFETGKTADKDDAVRAQFELALDSMKVPSHIYDSDIPIDYVENNGISSQTWILRPLSKSMYYIGDRANITKVSLAISSNADKSISVTATENANGIMDKMGLVRIRIQRYFKGRWLTVSTTTDTYSYGVSRFIYTAGKTNCVSGSYYRVTATFTGWSGGFESVVTKTTGSVRCR